jgi:hypothetical protein
MEMMGGMIGGVVGLIGAGLQYSAQQEANQIAWANLNFQKRQADNQYRLSTASRGDAYGNKQGYDPISNEWETTLTPTQNQIIKAGETEQLKSLTEDATRNRIIKRQQKDRSIVGAERYNDALAGYQYDQPDSEESIRNQIMDALTQGAQQATNASKDTLMLQAVRLGRGGDVAKIIKASDDDLGQRLPQMMAQSRDLARNEHMQRVQAHDQQYLPEIAAFDKIIQESNPAALQPFSNVPQQLSLLQQNQFAGMESAMQAGSNEVGGAYATLAKSLGQSPDLSGVAKAFSGLGGGGGGGGGRSKGRSNSGSSGFGQQSTDDGWWNTPEYQAWNTGFNNTYGNNDFWSGWDGGSAW